MTQTRKLIGQKYVLWHTEYRSDAYRDQFGHTHGGYVVLEQIPVTITEVRDDVPGMFGDSRHTGWKAVSESGEEFTCNWKRFPDDAMTPTFYWDARGNEGDLWRPVDACQAYNMGVAPYVTPGGQKATPAGATVCEKHDFAHLKGDDNGCFRCYGQTLNIRQRQ